MDLKFVCIFENNTKYEKQSSLNRFYNEQYKYFQEIILN